MKKTLVALLLCVAMLVTSVCAFAGEYPISEETKTFHMITRVRPLHGDPSEMIFFKNLEELTNIHIDWEPYPQAEYDESIKNAILGAGKNLPEAYFGKYCLSTDDLVNYGSQGIFIPLQDLIAEYAPNLTALFERRPDIKALVTAPDGNIYSTPFVHEGEDGTIASNMMINKTWLDRLGLEVPTTIEELETVLTAFKEQDANGNGDPSDEIPLTFKFLGSQRDLGGLFGAFGYPDTLTVDGSHIVIDNGQLVYVPATEGYKEACKYIYEHFTSKGLLHMEGFTMDKKTYNSQNQGEIANIGMFFCWNSFDLGTIHENEYIPMSPVAGPGGRTPSWGWTASNTMMATGFTITNVCKDPVTLIKWIDTFYDPIWGMQCDLGPIGVNLIDNGDGSYSYIDTPEGMSYDEFRNKNAYASDGPIALTSELFGTMLERSAAHQAKFDRNENYYRKYAIYEYLPTMMFNEEDNDELSMIKTDLWNYTNEKRAAWLAYGGVEEEWDEYLNNLNARGLEDYMEINQRTYDVSHKN